MTEQRCEHCALPRLRTLKQLAAETGVSIYLIRGAVARRELPVTAMGANGAGPFYIDPADWKRLVQARTRRPRRPDPPPTPAIDPRAAKTGAGNGRDYRAVVRRT